MMTCARVPTWSLPMLGRSLLLCIVLASGSGAAAQDICASGASAVNPLVAGLRAAPGDGGIGGTGISSDRKLAGATGGEGGGIGGTGIRLGNTDTGTGGIGGTGIVGVITGFASICVNGVEVQFDASTPVSDAGQPLAASALAVGQLVAVRASESGNRLTAQRIAVIDTAVGPLDAVDAGAGTFRLLGQTGHVAASQGLANLLPGDWVRVSGQRQAGGQIAVSRLARVEPQSQVQLNGVVDRMLDNGVAMIGGARVQVDLASQPAGLSAGSEITVSGRWDGRTLHANRALVEPTRGGIGQVSRVVLAGYVHALSPQRLSLGLGDLLLRPDTRVDATGAASLAVGQHVVVTGRVGADRQVQVDSIVVREDRVDGGRAGAQSRSRTDDRRSDRTSRSADERSGPRAREPVDRTDRSGGAGGTDSSGSSGGSGKSGGDSSGEGSGSEGSGSGGSGGGSEGSGGSGGSGGGSGRGK